jgi:peptide/nickel transport system permease protein
VLDRVSSAGAFGMLSIPPFVIGVFLVFVFAVRLHLLPASGFTHLSDSIGQNLRSMVLPSLTLAAGSVALYLRVLRSDMIATLQQDFITTARATGMRDRAVLLRHALKPSSFTLLTVVGLNIAILIGGAVLVEDVFQLPGMGLLAVTAIQQRDYLTVQGVVVVAAVGFVVVNLAVDILYGLLDPRVRSANATR